MLAACLQDNATFLHVNYWSDDQTVLQNVGLLLDAPGLSPLDMAGLRPLPGRNFVLASNQQTLVPLLRSVAGVSLQLPFLAYLSANISLTSRCDGQPCQAAVRACMLQKQKHYGCRLGALDAHTVGPWGS